MSKEQCKAVLHTAAEYLEEMTQMLDEDDGLNAFVEIYEDVTQQLARALAIAVRSAIPEVEQ